MLLGAIVSLFISIAVWQWLTPNLKISARDFNFNHLKEFVRTGIWMLLNQFGTLLLIGVDLVIANRLFGAETGGRYASVMQWSAMLRSFAMVIAGVFGPTIVALYARNEIDALMKYSRQSVKFMGLVVALPVSLLCGFSAPLLTVWLGPEFKSLAPLMSIMTVHLCLNLGYIPLHHIMMATNRVRVPGLLQIFIGALNVALAIWMAKTLGWGLAGIALAGGVTLCIKNIVFTPIYAAHILGRPKHIFFKELLPIVLATAVMTTLGWRLATSFDLVSWPKLGIAVCAVSLVYIAALWTLLLDSEERKSVTKILRMRAA
jgi:membrane protein EpsK